MKVTKFTLPYPPSLNHAHWHGKKHNRILKPEAREFYNTAKTIARAAGAEMIEGRPCVALRVYRAATNEDAENRAKLTLDALQGICYVDDKLLKEIHIYCEEAEKPKRKNARVEVEVWAA